MKDRGICVEIDILCVAETAWGLYAWRPRKVGVMGVFSSGSDRLAEGDSAPRFELPDQNGKTHCLEDYLGRWVVLYFYPRDDTPGCTREACQFRDDYSALGQMDVVVLGVSLDDEKSHAAFTRKYGLPFTLLSDSSGRVAAQYGSLMSLGFFKYARRHSFIIDPEGRLARIYRSVDPKVHSGEVMAVITALGS